MSGDEVTDEQSPITRTAGAAEHRVTRDTQVTTIITFELTFEDIKHHFYF